MGNLSGNSDFCLAYSKMSAEAARNPLLPGAQIPSPFWGSPVYADKDGRHWCPGFDGETFSTNQWDYIKFNKIAGLAIDRTPGVCRVTVHKGHDVDKKKPPGAHGARHTSFGIKPADFNVEIEIWTPEQLRQLQILWAYVLTPKSDGSLKTIDVTHPMFGIHSIKSMQFVSGSGPVVSHDRRGVFTMHVLEFMKPSTGNIVNTPTASVAAMTTLYSPSKNPLPGSNKSDLAPQ